MDGRVKNGPFRGRSHTIITTISPRDLRTAESVSRGPFASSKTYTVRIHGFACLRASRLHLCKAKDLDKNRRKSNRCMCGVQQRRGRPLKALSHTACVVSVALNPPASNGISVCCRQPLKKPLFFQPLELPKLRSATKPKPKPKLVPRAERFVPRQLPPISPHHLLAGVS